MVEVRVFITDGEGRKKQYGDPIKVLSSDVTSGYEDIMHRVGGATVLYGEKRVGVEISADKERKIIIVGSKKMIVYDDVLSDAKIQIYDKGIDKKKKLDIYKDFGEFHLIQRAGDIYIPKIEPIEPLSLECRHFIECIKTRKKPLSDGRFSLPIVKILEYGIISMKEGGKTVSIKY